MAQAVIAQKLESLRRCVARIASRCPDTAVQLRQDLDAQDIVSLNLSRAIQLCVDIAAHWLVEEARADAPQTMGQAFLALAQAGKLNEGLAQRLRKAVGFRNIVVHNYEDVNWDIVFNLCQERLADFRDFAAAFRQRQA